MKIPVRISEIQDISPTVKSFVLDLQGQAFSFLAGQWIDCFVEIDGRTEVAGYSITSSPSEVGWFSIAVKLVGDNAVTDYMHEQAAVGETLVVDGGQGEFYFDPATESGGSDSPIALIAGGIGITPIASIVRVMDKSAPDIPATLLYSASAPAELLFRDEFKAIAARNPQFRAYFTITRSSGELWDGNVGENRCRYAARSRRRWQHALLHLWPARDDTRHRRRTARNRRAGQAHHLRAVVVISGALARPKPPKHSGSPTCRRRCRCTTRPQELCGLGCGSRTLPCSDLAHSCTGSATAIPLSPCPTCREISRQGATCWRGSGLCLCSDYLPSVRLQCAYLPCRND